MKSKGPGENNLKATSESYSGNVSNQDTTSKQHHSRTEITTKTRLIICFQNKIFFFFFHTCHIPGAWSISKCCPNSIRISSWLRRRKTISSRLISLYPQWTISCHVTAFLYWISPGLHLLNTNTESWHLLQNILLGMTCWKRNQNVSRYLAACQLPQLVKCGSSVFPGIYKD